ncbi:hypothetical protein GCM10007216_15540 [Thalassobacillus devorans]|uniref:PilZ domain-containing protein n=1 Tax=Thalassobacillus devorans TaxID=279813 RepID=A0ABQ1NWX7_9BACI|nr:PilZ domain-containing protein [Thalassobacillus devorans]NIK28504.1 hypothetical protein [Thalassobacillus devorans]GGC85710.1 hypothetical protein GCM10007216_15540 [Thalassobacillus devorans]
MYYRRNEAFRYAFDPSLPGNFIAQTTPPIKGELHILDLSVKGMKVEVPVHDYQIGDRMIIQFNLVNQQLDVDGQIVWVKNFGRKVQVGIQLHTSEDMQKQLVSQLKLYVKQK